MSQYKKLSELIVDRLRDGPKFLHFLCAHDVREECNRLAEAEGRDAFRVMDAMLQKMRKEGVIAYSSKTGWGLK